MRLFDELNIETQSTCNRTCATCLRQSHPQPDPARSSPHQLPTDLVLSLLDQAAALDFRGHVVLQHFNEPLQDERIGYFGRYARAMGRFAEVYLNTNGDYLTAERAAELDGTFDRLHIALYGGDRLRRAAQYADWFSQTRLSFTAGEHVVTHFSPFANLAEAIAAAQGQPCQRESQRRCIIGYDGRMLLCCEDIAAAYELGNAHATPLAELWYGERHTAILTTLSHPGGRRAYDYCRSCPRSNTPYWPEDAL